MGTRVLIGSEYADIVRDTDAMPSRYELVELIRSGGPRAGRAMGWGVLDNVENDAEGNISVSVLASKWEAQAAVVLLSEEG
jgi:hypothetical protein